MGREKKKSKKEKRDRTSKKSKDKKKRKYSSSSSSTSGTEDEWVEKRSSDKKPVDKSSTSFAKPNDESDDPWGLVFSGTSTADIRRSKETAKEVSKKSREDDTERLSRELNPYWKNGGNGLPPEKAGRFKKPNDINSERDVKYGRNDDDYKSGYRRKNEGWRKPNDNKSDRDVKNIRNDDEKSLDRRKSVDKSPTRENIAITTSNIDEVPKTITRNEMNRFCANLFRAEIEGDENTAGKLREELTRLRSSVGENNTVILTETDDRGYTRPVNRDDRGDGRKKHGKVQTHENNKRVRYFADDDDVTLQEMFEKEKYSSTRDQEESFMNLMGKEMGRKDGSLALDDPFEETASIDDRGKREKKQWDRAVREEKRKEKIYDECKWCYGAKRMNSNLVVKMAQKAYICSPPFQYLTEGHCLIIPHAHTLCSVQADEDVWNDVTELRRELVRLYRSRNQDVIFFENASQLDKHPHMLIHCVPVPREIGDEAPIYFKKALLECESEWSSNKKVVDLAGRGVRKAIPKGLPYFVVDFGEQYGYAHVVEDKRLFPNNFAQEIIGGMLDLDHGKWRKPKNLYDEELMQNVNYLKSLITDD